MSGSLTSPTPSLSSPSPFPSSVETGAVRQMVEDNHLNLQICNTNDLKSAPLKYYKFRSLSGHQI